MSLKQFSEAASFLGKNEIALRTFILVNPPFLDKTVAPDWIQRSVQFAFDCGSTVVCLIPTRPGNGALEALRQEGHFAPPHLAEVEQAAEAALGLNRGRVFVDLWNLEQFSTCTHCFRSRHSRLLGMNFTQKFEQRPPCPACGS